MSFRYLSFAGSNLRVSAFCCDVIRDFSNTLLYKVPISLFTDARCSISRLLIFHAMEKRDLEMPPYSRATVIDEGTEERIGPFSVSYMRTIHPVPCLAVRLSCDGKSIVYTADGAFSDRIAAFAASSDILIAECSFYPGIVNRNAGHMDACDVAELAVAASPGKLVVSHLPVYGNREEILCCIKERWNGEVILARSSLEIEA